MKKINLLFFLLLPFIDVVTALTTRFIDLPVTIGIIIKSLYLLALTIYIIFFSKSKKRKSFIYYLVMVLGFSLLYFVTKIDLINKSYLFKECTGLFKVFYSSVLFYGLLVLSDDYKFKNEKISKIMFYSLISYSLLLIMPYLTNTGFGSYSEAFNNEGSIGWFYSANDISAILLMLYPFTYMFLDKKIDKNNKKTYLYYLILIPIIYSVFIIGTKTSWIGLVLITVILLIISLLKEGNKQRNITLLLVLLALIPLTLFSPVVSNMKKNMNDIDTNSNEPLTEAQQREIAVRNACKFKDTKEIFKNETVYKIVNKVLSGRQDKAYSLIHVYTNSSILDKTFGVGFSNTNRVEDCNVERYVEIDLLDALIHYGIIGLIIVLIPFVHTIKYIIKNKLDTEKTKYISIVLIMILISCLAGHVIGYPTSGIYLSIYLLLLCMNNKKVEL